MGKTKYNYGTSYDRERGRPAPRQDDDDAIRIPAPELAAREYDRLLRKLTDGLQKETLSEKQIDAIHDKMDELWWDMSEEDQKKADDDATRFVREGKVD